jgi:polysaccharide pyruvyl transferase WcaK-like protein
LNKVCLCGASVDTGNMGVSALAISFVEIMRQIDKDMEVSLLIGSKEPGTREIDLKEGPFQLKVVNFRRSPKSNIQEHVFWILLLAILYYLSPLSSFKKKIVKSNRFLNEIYNSKFIGSIHGGDSFSDIYGLSRFIWVIFPDIITLLLRKPLILLPQTYGPYNSTIVKKIARLIIRKAKYVLCRDKNGPDAVQDIIGTNKNIQKVLHCPDVAFCLHFKKNVADVGKFRNEEFKNKALIGINVNGLMYNGGYTRKNMFGLDLDYGKLIEKIIEKFLSESDSNLILIPHNMAAKGNVESDLEACEKVSHNIPENLKNRIHISEIKDTPSKVKSVISQCNFFIGSRMHSCIAALSSGIPTVGIAYSKKFIGVFESVGVRELVVDARSDSIESALNHLWKNFLDRDNWDIVLKEKKNSIHGIIIATFQQIVDEYSLNR